MQEIFSLIIHHYHLLYKGVARGESSRQERFFSNSFHY